MSDKNSGELALHADRKQAGNAEYISENSYSVTEYLALQKMAGCNKVLGWVFFGILLSVVVAWQSHAEAGVSSGISSETNLETGTEPGLIDAVAIIPAVLEARVVRGAQDMGGVSGPAVAGSPAEQASSAQQRVLLQVSSLEGGYGNQRVIAKDTVANGDSEDKEAKSGIPYAIALAMIALIGLVPVARRNGGL